MSERFTVPGLDRDKSRATVELLQERLVALLDLSLVLKHVHWNVVGPTFIGVHEMLDPQVDAVRAMSDETAERIATLGGSPNGLAGYIVASRSWDDYSVARASVAEHLAALDLVYSGVVSDHRDGIQQLEELDPVTQDMLIGQSQQLEQFQWFVRAHLETSSGELITKGAGDEVEAAEMASARSAAKNTEGGDGNGARKAASSSVA